MRARLMVIAAAITAMVAGAVAWLRRSTRSDATPASGRRPGASTQAVPAARPAPAANTPAAEVAAAEVAAVVEDATAANRAPTAQHGADDLQLIKGIGAISAERLHDIGVTTFAEIAAWTPGQLDEIAGQIRISAERIRREDWVGQARAIADS